MLNSATDSGPAVPIESRSGMVEERVSKILYDEIQYIDMDDLDSFPFAPQN